MSSLWVILSDDKSTILEAFETEDPSSLPYQDKFKRVKAGCVWCKRISVNTGEGTWYFSQYVWNDLSRWGYDEPDLITWGAAMTLPESIKMLEIVNQ